MKRLLTAFIQPFPYIFACVCVVGAILMFVVNDRNSERLYWIPPFVMLYIAWRLIVDVARSWAAVSLVITLILAILDFHESSFPVFALIAVAAFLALVGAVQRHAGPSPEGKLSGTQLTEQALAGISVAVSSCCCTILGIRAVQLLSDAFAGRYQHKIGSVVVVLGVLVVVVVFFIEPTIGFLNRTIFSLPFERRRGHRWPARFAVLIFGALTVTLHKLFDEVATNTVSSQDKLLVVLFVMSLLLPGQITGGWIKGVAKQSESAGWDEKVPLAAALFGSMRALVFALVFVFLLWTTLQSSLLQVLWSLSHPSNGLSIVVDTPDIWRGSVSGFQGRVTSVLGLLPPWPRMAVIMALNWGILAFAGGLATKLKGSVVKSISAALLLALSLEIAGQYILFTPYYWTRFAGFQILMVIGWVLGISIYPPGQELLSGMSSETTYHFAKASGAGDPGGQSSDGILASK